MYVHVLGICVISSLESLFRLSHIIENCVIKEALPGCGWPVCFYWISLPSHSEAHNLSILFFYPPQIRICVLQRMGAAGERMPDTYVAERWHLSVTCLIAHIGKSLTDVARSRSPTALCEGNFTCKENEVCVRPNECRCRHGYFGASCDTSKSFLFACFFSAPTFHWLSQVLSHLRHDSRASQKNLRQQKRNSRWTVYQPLYPNCFVIFLPFRVTSLFIFVVLTFDLAHKPEHFH